MHVFANVLLNSLSAQIAVLDAHGTVVAVNEAWRRFARENGGDDKAFYVGTNYLSVCEDAARCGGDGVAEAVLHGLRDLLRGERVTFSIEYPCHSPDEERWFIAFGTRFIHEGATYLVITHEDFTARKKAEDRLQESETILRSVLEALPVGVWIMDQEGKIVHVNPAGLRIWAGARYVGPDQFGEYKAWWLSTGRRITAEEWAGYRAIRKGETSIGEEIRIECFDGSSKIILNSAIPLRNETGRVTGAIIVNQDITVRKHMEEQLLQANTAIDATNQELQRVLAREQIKSRTDELTGLSNRRHFLEMSERLFTVAQRYRTPLSVILFDVDHFKRFNDMFGHQVGDTILQRVARIARERLRNADVFARYGGEEFIVTLSNTTAPEAFAVADDLRAKIAADGEVGEKIEASVTISVGVAEILPEGDTLDRLIQRADQALYIAKNAGRNCTKVFSPVP